MSARADWISSHNRWPFFSNDEADELGFCECGHPRAAHQDGGRCGWTREKTSCACMRWQFDEDRSDPEFFLERVPRAEWPMYVWAYLGMYPPPQLRR